MLIVTNSVEASGRREDELLTNVEELEGKLVVAAKEREGKDGEISAARARLREMEEDAERHPPSTMPRRPTNRPSPNGTRRWPCRSRASSAW